MEDEVKRIKNQNEFTYRSLLNLGLLAVGYGLMFTTSGLYLYSGFTQGFDTLATVQLHAYLKAEILGFILSSTGLIATILPIRKKI